MRRGFRFLKGLNRRTVISLVCVLFSELLFLAACGGRSIDNSAAARKEAEGTPRGASVLVISEQYGLAYAPLQIMRLKGFLEEELPDYRISWERLGNTAAIREAMLAGRIDIGFMGIPPFLIGFDRGMKWKIFTGLSEAPLGLVTWKDDIDSLRDFSPGDRIALPQPGSIQHILLAMACERELGRADALDDILVTMNHPDGMQALLNRREVSAHFTSPPYLMEELSAPDMRQVVTGTEAMGDRFTFIVGVAVDRVLREEPAAVDALRRALERSKGFMRDSQDETIDILSEEYGIDPEQLRTYLRWEGLIYSSTIRGLERFIDFMHDQSYLNNSFEEQEVLYKR